MRLDVTSYPPIRFEIVLLLVLKARYLYDIQRHSQVSIEMRYS